jgi:hypothetical protein
MVVSTVRTWVVAGVAGLLACAATWPAGAADPPPGYELQFLGSGSPSAINDTGVVVGARTVDSNYVPLVSVAGAPWSVLPAPAGAVSTLPTDVNDYDVIVGVSYDAQRVAKAVRWTPQSGGGWAVEFLPRLAGDTSSYATAVNNLGQVVGARSALGFVPTGGGWLLDGSTPVDLAARYGWYAVVPSDLNDFGQVLGGAERLDLNRGIVEWIGTGPANYQPVTGVAINGSGRIAGTAALRSTSLNVVSAFRYDPGSGWTFIAGSSRYTVASSVNDRGDVAYGELGPGVYLEGSGTYAVNDLLTSATVQAGWAATGNGGEMNDLRMYATLGRNSITGQAGAVLLVPVGSVVPPTAPTNLQALAHPATAAAPYDSIDLSWQNTSVLTRGYELQRSPAGTGSWTALALVPPGTGTSHTDTTVAPDVRYDYRVRATGIGGASPWSNVATATAPTAQSVAVLRVSAITLGAKLSRGRVTVNGDVAVVDQRGTAAGGAVVTVRWTLPAGTQQQASATTGSDGHARFTTKGVRGTYVLTVVSVSRSGATYDAAGSLTSASITR